MFSAAEAMAFRAIDERAKAGINTLSWPRRSWRPPSGGQNVAEWTAPAELDQPLPRPVKRRSVFTYIVISQVAGFFLFVAIMGGKVGADIYKTHVLKERGVTAAGTVTNLYTTNRKGGVDYNVTYAYPIVPKPAYTATDQLDVQDFNQLHVGDAVPVAYDPLDPPRSLLNFNNSAFARDKSSELRIASIVLAVSLLCTSFVQWTFIRDYRKQKRFLQWGKAAAATITSETEYNAGRAGRRVAVAYTFIDESGRVVQGERKGLPVKKQRKGNTYDKMLANPTVLYDPEDSAKNMLYPFAFADCPPKPQPSVFSA